MQIAKRGRRVGQSVTDLEWGWTLTHQDLVICATKWLGGAIDDNSRPHGTSVLGVICANGQPDRCIGIASKAAVSVISHDGHATEIANRITALTPGSMSNYMLNPGDVVLLEATVAGGPACETQDHVATAIQVATSSSQGIVVIEGSRK